jgi:hypothetical protein
MHLALINKKMTSTICSLIVCLVLVLTSAPAIADPVIVRTEAYGGDEVGVAKIVFRLDESDQMAIQTNAVFITSPDNRAFYPAFSLGLLDQMYAPQWTSIVPSGGTHTVWFLFRGDEPIDVTIHANGSASTTITVNDRRPRLRNIMMTSWWREYNGALRRSEKMGDVPPLANRYLKTTLKKRLGLNEPLLDRIAEAAPNPLEQTLALIVGGESTKAAAIEDVLTRPTIDRTPQPMLPDPVWALRWIPPSDENLPLEPMAAHIPQECFYLRFGQWKNQLWLKSLMQEYGGDLSRMVSLRGYKQPQSADFLNQLVLESSDMDDLLGGQLISDVAVIGHDLFFDDGAAVGIVLESKGDLLKSNLLGKRKRYAENNKENEVTITEEKIGENTVSVLTSPDNFVRSFYVQDGDYHLITNSRALIMRFLQAGRGAGTLAENPGFQLARTTYPVDRNDTVFVYLSPEFFQNLVGPEYQIGLRRRTESNAARQVCMMARWAAANEGLKDLSFDELVRYGFLPANNDSVLDQFQLVQQLDQVAPDLPIAQVNVPIPDQQIDTITADEAQWYRDRIATITEQFPTFDPILVAIKRYALEKNVERVTFDARLAPFGQENYGWISSVLGPPLNYEVTQSPEDLVTIQMSVKGGMLRPEIGAHQIFGAIQNDAQSVELAPMTFFEWIKFFKSVPGYIGAWPKPGYLDLIPFGLGGHPDQWGYTKSALTGLWRLQHGEFSVLSFDRDRLEMLRPNLDITESKRNAQVRLHVGDVANSNLAGWANRLSYQRTWQTSVSNVRSANQLTQQLGVTPSRAMNSMERMIGVNLVCPLGGEYQLVQANATQYWQSTKWPNVVGSLPDDYQSPFLNWFKGAELEVTQVEGQFSVHGSLDIFRRQLPAASLPSFNLFDGFPAIKAIGSKTEKKEKQAPDKKN